VIEGAFLRELFFGLTFCMLLLSGCAAPSSSYMDAPYVGGLYAKTAEVGYPGDFRPVESVGVITHDAIITIKKVTQDGVPVELRTFKSDTYLQPTGRYQLHLLPGLYQVEFCFYIYDGNRAVWCNQPIVKTVDASAGKVVHYAWINSGKTWGIAEYEGAGDLPEIKADFQQLTNKGRAQ
jgi:hypothetical protein